MWAFKVALVVKNSHANAGDIRDTSSIPGSWRSPGGGRENPLQCSCLENPMDRGAWRAIVHRVTQSQTQLKWLGTHIHAKATYICDVAQPPLCFLLQRMELPSIRLVAEAKTLGPCWTPHFPHCLQMVRVIRTFSSISEVNFHVPPSMSISTGPTSHEVNAGPSYQGPKWLLCLLQHFSLSWSHPIGVRKYFNSLAVQFLGLGSFTAEAMSSVPG